MFGVEAVGLSHFWHDSITPLTHFFYPSGELFYAFSDTRHHLHPLSPMVWALNSPINGMNDFSCLPSYKKRPRKI
jgi:hypothetical protein